jgi:hypothetical protein
MHSQTLNWIATKALDAIRSEEIFAEEVGYELGGMPFIDAIRKQVRAEDKKHILRLIHSERWSQRYLGTNMSRPILDDEIINSVRSAWRDEPHFHTQLAMIYLLFHAGVTSSEEEEIIRHLDSARNDFLPCIHRFYDGHKEAVWGGLCERLDDKRFAGAQSIYLLSLTLLKETEESECGLLPTSVNKLAESERQLIRDLSLRLRNAFA